MVTRVLDGTEPDGRRKAPYDGVYTIGKERFFTAAGAPLPEGAVMDPEPAESAGQDAETAHVPDVPATDVQVLDRTGDEVVTTAGIDAGAPLPEGADATEDDAVSNESTETDKRAQTATSAQTRKRPAPDNRAEPFVPENRSAKPSSSGQKDSN